MVRGFSNPLVTAFYVVAMGALALHLFHGAWSSFRTLGLTRPSANPLRRTAAAGLAIVVALGFIAVPLAIAFRVIGPEPAAETTAVAPPQER